MKTAMRTWILLAAATALAGANMGGCDFLPKEDSEVIMVDRLVEVEREAPAHEESDRVLLYSSDETFKEWTFRGEVDLGDDGFLSYDYATDNWFFTKKLDPRKRKTYEDALEMLAVRWRREEGRLRYASEGGTYRSYDDFGSYANSGTASPPSITLINDHPDRVYISFSCFRDLAVASEVIRRVQVLEERGESLTDVKYRTTDETCPGGKKHRHEVPPFVPPAEGATIQIEFSFETPETEIGTTLGWEIWDVTVEVTLRDPVKFGLEELGRNHHALAETLKRMETKLADAENRRSTDTAFLKSAIEGLQREIASLRDSLSKAIEGLEKHMQDIAVEMAAHRKTEHGACDVSALEKALAEAAAEREAIAAALDQIQNAIEKVPTASVDLTGITDALDKAKEAILKQHEAQGLEPHPHGDWGGLIQSLDSQLKELKSALEGNPSGKDKAGSDQDKGAEESQKKGEEQKAPEASTGKFDLNIGATVAELDGKIEVIDVSKDSPADKAGVKKGDRVYGFSEDPKKPYDITRVTNVDSVKKHLEADQKQGVWFAEKQAGGGLRAFQVKQ